MTNTLFQPKRPGLVLWQPDSLLAALLVRMADSPAEVTDFRTAEELLHDCRQRPTAILVGPAPLSTPDALRLLHQIHRKTRTLILGCGAAPAAICLTAGELGVATIVATIHDAVPVAQALKRFLRSC